jgi:DNA (cytosine-5)-methyltransferase 1
MKRGRAYYNEFDPFAAAWLRELIRGGHIADGDVDERDIREVQADDVREYRQVHFFAGIGGWSLALRLAGWPDDRPVWTGSCPCQSFSSAGTRKGHGDARDLWPEFLRLIRECRPATVFGEQVEAAIRFGWLDGVFVDLEQSDYACGSAVLPAACVGAPHIRQRLWWVADARRAIDERLCRSGEASGETRPDEGEAQQRQRGRAAAGTSGSLGFLGDTNGSGFTFGTDAGANRTRRTSEAREAQGRSGEAGDSSGRANGLAFPASLMGERGQHEQEREAQGRATDRRAGARSFWCDSERIQCRDGKARRIEPGTFPLAHGVPARVGRLRGYGNAIVPEVAAEFIKAFCEGRAVA